MEKKETFLSLLQAYFAQVNFQKSVLHKSKSLLLIVIA